MTPNRDSSGGFCGKGNILTGINLNNGEDGWEESPTAHTVWTDSLDVLFIRYVTCQFKQFEVEDHDEDYVGSRREQGGRLPSANITDTGSRRYIYRVRTCGITEDLETGGTTNVAVPPGALSSVIFQIQPSSGSASELIGRSVLNLEVSRFPSPHEISPSPYSCGKSCHKFPNVTCTTRNSYSCYRWLLYHFQSKSYVKCPKDMTRNTTTFVSAI